MFITGATALVKRFDAVTLQKPTRTDEGYLATSLRCTRTGVFLYSMMDGSVFREYRPESEVFAKDSMATLKMKPITNDHPLNRMVNADNAQMLMKGVTGQNPVKDETFLSIDGVIMDKATIDDVEAGKQELSCGYDCTLDMTPGETPEGEKYDAVQTKIRYNHVAIVDRGRAGRDARIRMDSELNLITEEAMKVKIKIDGVEFEVEEAVAKVIQAAETAKADAATKIGTLTTELETTKASVATLQGKVDALDNTTKNDADKKKFNAAVKSRLTLIDNAKKCLPEEEHVKLVDTDDVKILEAVIKHSDKDAVLEGKSEDYLKARFDAILALTGKETKADGEEMGKLIVEGRTDAKTEEAIAKADKERHDKLTGGWKKPLSASKDKVEA